MITRLDAAGAAALHAQTATTPGHTVSMVILEASDQLDHDRLADVIASTLPRIGRFRSRLVSKPFGVGQPVWAEFDDFDPTSHVHRASVSAPGDDLALAQLVTRLTEQQQEWRRSLWEAWSIDGLAGGRWALAVKTSPVLRDDAAAMWHRLLASEPDAGDHTASEAGPGPAPSRGELLTDALSEMVENQLAAMWLVSDAVTDALAAARRRLEEPAGVHTESTTTGPVPMTAFMAPLTKRRSTAFATIRTADVKAVSAAFGGNTANVVLAACTLSLRAWLQRHDSGPGAALLMSVPLSLPAADPAEAGEAVATGKVRLPVQLSDPVQVLTDLHTATERLNIANNDIDESEGGQASFATAVSLLPPWVTQAGRQVFDTLGVTGRRRPECHGTVSFVGGNPRRAYCAGVRVVGMHTVEPLTASAGMTINVTSHDEVMDLCVSACPDNVPCIDELGRGIVDGVGVLLAAAVESPRGEGRSVVTEMGSHHSRHAQA